MGASEQAGIQAAVKWLEEQPWSSGQVGLIGLGYDGAAAWEGAALGDSHIKTIVPINGPVGAYEWLWRNGTAKEQAPLEHFDPPSHLGALDRRTCKDKLASPAEGATTYLNGAPPSSLDPYWSERSYLPRVLSNYDGSVYFIQGLQDVTVPPHASVPAVAALRAAGIPTKAILGQWGHMLPDRRSDHEQLAPGRGAEAYPATLRYDWAQDLLEWFTYYLKQEGPAPSLHTEIQDNAGQWRIQDPSEPADWRELLFGDDLALSNGNEVVAGARIRAAANANAYTIVALESQPHADELHIAGQVRLHLTVTPSGAGGQLFAFLQDKTTEQRLGHAIMDLRFAEGGTEPHPVTPGARLVARMEFEPMDAVVPTGHVLELLIGPNGEDYLPSPTTAPIRVAVDASSLMQIPVTHPAPAALFAPPSPNP